MSSHETPSRLPHSKEVSSYNRRAGAPDMRKFTSNVCLVIKGGTMMGASYDSIPIEIPLYEIEAAIISNYKK
jgi:hypothetical protein